MFTKSHVLLAVAALGLFSGVANATLIPVSKDDFTASAALLTFDEVSPNTGNPVFEPAMDAGPLPTVTTGGWFMGQTSAEGCTGAGCLMGDPSAALTLSPDANPVVVLAVGDPADAVLTGVPAFRGPISLLFDKDIGAIGFDANFFDAPGTNLLTVFDRLGNTLYSAFNDQAGSQFFGVANEDGLNNIAGIQFTHEAGTNSGFAIDDVRFGPAGAVDFPDTTPPPTADVNEPARNVLVLLLGVFGIALGYTIRSRQR